MSNNIKFVTLTLLVLLCIISVSLLFKSDNPTTPIYIKGKDSVAVKSDTVVVYQPKYIHTTKTISDTVHIIHFQQDSSIVKDTVVHDLDTAIVQVTTYPKIDSLKLQLYLRLTEKIINVTDSIWITRVDTMQTTVIEPTAWYDNFIVGALTTAIVTLLVIIGVQ